jgi:hypothetical protein
MTRAKRAKKKRADEEEEEDWEEQHEEREEQDEEWENKVGANARKSNIKSLAKGSKGINKSESKNKTKKARNDVTSQPTNVSHPLPIVNDQICKSQASIDVPFILSLIDRSDFYILKYR